jgi:hypothetical protein
VVAVDGFGNVQLNATPAELEAAGLGPVLAIGARDVPRVSTFADVSPGGCGAIVDSDGYVALVVNHGSAAHLLGLSTGDAVVLGG